MRITGSILLLISFFLTSCTTFVTEGEMTKIKAIETKVYRLKKDIDVEGKGLSKNTIVRIVVRQDKTWIKAYAYRADVPRLKAELVRVVYLFNSDFPKKQFDYDFFRTKLSEVLQDKGKIKVRKGKKNKIKKRTRRRLKKKRYKRYRRRKK